MKRGDVIWGGVFTAITAFLVIPETRHLFEAATRSHPYIMGFVKFAIMASMGELLTMRMLQKQWKKPAGFAAKAIVWGIIGMVIVAMFALYSDGVAGLLRRGLLYAGQGKIAAFLTALFTSAIMNGTFGIVLMLSHKISDTYIDLRTAREKPNFQMTLKAVDWPAFFSFVIGKTIPLFWIPTHTITFLLPAEYRVLAAAYLSVALGMILAYAKLRNQQKQ